LKQIAGRFEPVHLIDNKLVNYTIYFMLGRSRRSAELLNRPS